MATSRSCPMSSSRWVKNVFRMRKSKAASYIFSFYARAGISHSNRINFVTFAEGTACLNGT